MNRAVLILCLLFFLFFVAESKTSASDFPEVRTSEKDLFPKPVDGYVAQINPPGFSWLPVKNAHSYLVQIKEMRTSKIVLEEKAIQTNVFVPQKVLNQGEYFWIIQAFDKNANLLAERRPYHFTIPSNIVKQPFPDLEKIFQNLPQSHSRLVFLQHQLPEIQKSLNTTRKAAWKILRATADSCLKLGAPPAPDYGHYDIENEYTLRRLAYQKYYRGLREYLDRGLQALSLVWLLTGEEKYANAAKRILLEIVQWDPAGISSCQHSGFDEVGLSLSRVTHRAYDWLYEALTEDERQLVQKNCIARARDTFERVALKRQFHSRPGSSHDGRLIGYIGEQALVLAGEAPDEEVRQWLDYSLKAFMTVYPHWGGDDGGWAEGMDYGPRYCMFIAPWIEGLRAVSDINLWQRPFFRNVRQFFMACTRPNAEFKPFGDGAEISLQHASRHTTGLAFYLKLHAFRFNDAVCQWWAEQLPLAETYKFYPVIPLIPEFSQPAPRPAITSKANVFFDVGWCALHSDFSSLDQNVFLLFKSSPYASVSHSHADQNAFFISVGGQALAIPSGYYGPVYGMPHHAEWTRSTKANNCILVNGQGQAVRDFTATGEIVQFQHQNKITNVAGSAAPAYQGLLKRADRHIILVRPGLFVILDDLEASEPATFQWMLHTLEKMNLNSEKQLVESRRQNALLKVQLFHSATNPMQLIQTDQFDPPYLEGVPEVYRHQITDYWHETFNKDIAPHWHLTASTVTKQQSLRIAAIMWAGLEKDMPVIEYLNAAGWQGARINYADGIAELWAQLTVGAKLPESLSLPGKAALKGTIILGRWIPRDGSEIETIAAEPVILNNH